jgi:hypothetical protein
MKKWLYILFFGLSPAILFSQVRDDTAAVHPAKSPGYSLMFDAATVFYSGKDSRINNFLSKYGYTPPQNIPMGIRLEMAVMPSGSRMVYSINAETIVSKQSISTADFSLGIYRRFYEIKNLWILGGIALGEHFDRIVLNGNLPPSFDSLAELYGKRLSLHRIGLIAEPAAKVFWYPLQTKKTQAGFFAGVGYNLDFNSRWRLGYYPQNRNTFKRLKYQTDVSTIHEFGWALSAGLSICF